MTDGVPEPRPRMPARRRTTLSRLRYRIAAHALGRIWVELRIPGGDRQGLGDFPRDWPEEISARHTDPFVRPQRGVTLVEDRD